MALFNIEYCFYLCLGVFLASVYVDPGLSDHGLNLYYLHWKAKSNHWLPGKSLPISLFSYVIAASNFWGIVNRFIQTEYLFFCGWSLSPTLNYFSDP